MNESPLLRRAVRTALYGAMTVMISLPVHAAAPGDTQAIEARIEELAKQVELLKAQVQQLKSQNEALAAQQEQQPAAQGAQVASGTAGNSPWDRLRIWGYGEVNYSRPIHEPDTTQADLRRAVFGIGYKFDERTRFNSEFEMEHAVTSAEDAGEFEVEQFWIDHQFNDWLAVKGGMILMPFGYINETHEPVNYYGVQRNFIETLVIPSTWREGGVAVHGDTPFGLRWDAGLTTGLNLANWDINAELPVPLEDQAPLQATHQELALANASHLSQYLMLNYNGIAGYNAGAGIFSGVAVPFAAGLPDERVTLWEGHTRWRSGRADLQAIYARGTISNTADANRLYPGASNPIPASFFGYMAQAAYSVWQDDRQRLVPFARFERFNLGRSYEGIPQGFTADPKPTERVWTYGASFYINPNVVLKADYQSFHVDTAMDRLELGLGLSF